MDEPIHYGGGVDAPMLTEREDTLYQAIREGRSEYPGVLSCTHPHFAAGSLRVIAERLECDAQVIRLGDRVECRAGYGDRRPAAGDGLHCVAACVTLYWKKAGSKAKYNNEVTSVNAEAARRLADRLDSGMEPIAAIERTLEQCEHTPLSEAAVRDLEQKADCWVKTLREIDARFDTPGQVGSEAHRAAIREAAAQDHL